MSARNAVGAAPGLCRAAVVGGPRVRVSPSVSSPLSSSATTSALKRQPHLSAALAAFKPSLRLPAVSPLLKHKSNTISRAFPSTFARQHRTLYTSAPQRNMAETLHSRPVELAATLEKPLLDKRTYRVVQLPNELEVLLVHDADTDKASAAMDVAVGSFSDALDMPGLAHAVEHALFMGTKKYPGENEYHSYLNKFGGSSNAFTATTSTNYYFELSTSSTSNSAASSANASQSSLPIPKEKAPLYGALDRFSQFFVDPLFDANTLDRELRAVDSENKKNLQSDTWRMMQLGRTTGSEKHPHHKFATGNYKTLHDDPLARGVAIRDEFIGFYKKHYSANRMKLVVLGRESLDELESWVQELFTDVPNQNLPQLRWDNLPIYEQEQLGLEIFVKPVMESRSIELFFPYPDEDLLHASKPSYYISHLLGHEGPGSILAYIKAKGWANTLSAGASTMCPGSALFHVHIALTEEGLKRYREIVHVFFQYVALIKEEPPQKWIVDEMMKLSEVRFKFQQQIPASRMTSGVSGLMQKPYPRNELLSAQTLVRKFDPEAISRGLEAMSPNNFRLHLASKEYPGEWPLKEKWYGTEHKIQKLPEDYMKQLQDTMVESASSRPSEIHLPGKNEFVPQRLDVEKKDIAKPATTPKLVRNDANVRTWWKKDDQFWVPKANVYLTLRNPINNVSPFTTLMTHLYKDLVEDSLSEYSYDAELAGLSWGIQSTAIGLDVQVNGYNDKAAVLLEKALVSMRDLEVKDDRFEIIKERLMRNLKNFEWTEPFRMISSYSRWLMQPRGWAMFELLEELPAITAADVRAWYPQILRQMHIEMLVQGNFYKEDALNMTNLVERTLQPRRYPADQWQPKRSVILPPGSDYRWSRTLANPDNVNHCIDYVLHVGLAKDRPLRAKLLLMGQLLDEPCFDTLRTKEQLGYVVWSQALSVNTVQGFRVIIQSERDCEYLESRIDNFLTGFEKTLRDMPHEEFEKHKISLINKRLEKLKNLSDEGGRLWHHVTSEEYDFDLATHDVDHIEEIQQDALLEFYKTYFLPSSSTRAKFAVHLVAQASAEDVAAKAAANTDSTKQHQNLTSTLAQVLSQLGMTADKAALSSKLEAVDLKGNDVVNNIVAAVSGYLRDSAIATEEQITNVTEQGKLLLTQILPTLGINDTSAATNGEANGHAAPANGEQVVLNGDKKKEPVAIENVRAWKAELPVSEGALPVKHLSEFEELEPKL